MFKSAHKIFMKFSIHVHNISTQRLECHHLYQCTHAWNVMYMCMKFNNLYAKFNANVHEI